LSWWYARDQNIVVDVVAMMLSTSPLSTTIPLRSRRRTMQIMIGNGVGDIALNGTVVTFLRFLLKRFNSGQLR
jgi:hypothetical protein